MFIQPSFYLLIFVCIQHHSYLTSRIYSSAIAEYLNSINTVTGTCQELRLVCYTQGPSSVFDTGVERTMVSTVNPCCSLTTDSILNRAAFAETLEVKLQLWIQSSAVNQFGLKIISNRNYVYTTKWERSEIMPSHFSPKQQTAQPGSVLFLTMKKL